MKNWVPGDEGSHMSWDFKCGKENPRCKKDHPLDQPSNDFDNPFIELA